MRPFKDANSTQVLLFLTVVLAAVVFAVDLATPRGNIDGIAYIPVVWIPYFVRSTSAVWIAMIGCSILNVIGLISSPPGLDFSAALFNRSFTMLGIWATGIPCTHALRLLSQETERAVTAEELAKELAQHREDGRAKTRALGNMIEDLRIKRERLKASEMRFRAMFEAAPIAIIMSDESGQIILANTESEKLVGYTSEELEKMPTRELIPEEFKEVFDHFRDEYLNPPEDRSMTAGCELFIQTKSGDQVPVQFGLNAVETSEDVYVLCTILDISESKENAARLQAAKEAAESANRSRGEFLANMSHEIRTPITAILGYVDIMAERISDPDDLQALETIRRNGQHLLQIINDILDLSKVDAGQLAVNSEIVDVGALVHDVQSAMDVRANEKDLALDFRFAAGVPAAIEADPVRLRQILLNLISNAIKFTNEGGVTVTVSYDRQPRALRFEIADTGIGIREKEFDKLFKPFSQADSTSTRAYDGTGLGLVISRKLAQALGGDITFTSTYGKGSRFSLTVGCKDMSGKRLVDPQRWSTVQTSNLHHQLRIDATVLIVDDRRDIRFLAQHIVEKAGGRVLTATNGREAVSLLTSTDHAIPDVDLVLMDMQMPIQDGYDATRALRRHGFNKPIIALTANAMKDDRERCIAVGCTDFAPKPIDGAKLLEVMVRALNASMQD